MDVFIVVHTGKVAAFVYVVYLILTLLFSFQTLSVPSCLSYTLHIFIFFHLDGSPGSVTDNGRSMYWSCFYFAYVEMCNFCETLISHHKLNERNLHFADINLLFSFQFWPIKLANSSNYYPRQSGLKCHERNNGYVW